MNRILNNNYLVECCQDLKAELEENEKQGYTINWFNFQVGDIYYDDNGNEYYVKEVSHNSKYIVLE